jgi:hypothetical protein
VRRIGAVGVDAALPDKANKANIKRQTSRQRKRQRKRQRQRKAERTHRVEAAGGVGAVGVDAALQDETDRAKQQEADIETDEETEE